VKQILRAHYLFQMRNSRSQLLGLSKGFFAHRTIHGKLSVSALTPLLFLCSNCIYQRRECSVARTVHSWTGLISHPLTFQSNYEISYSYPHWREHLVPSFPFSFSISISYLYFIGVLEICLSGGLHLLLYEEKNLQ
jgi:hypothetical protein